MGFLPKINQLTRVQLELAIPARDRKCEVCLGVFIELLISESSEAIEEKQNVSMLHRL